MSTSTPDPSPHPLASSAGTGPPAAPRLRFCPSPTGTPHVGLARTALFNWAYARHTGGSLVFRIENTDAARDSEESVQAITDALAWLGIDYDEGPDAGGDYGPYRQSERRDIYAEVIAKLVDGGYAYESFSTPQEVQQRHRQAGRDPQLGYDNYDRDLTEQQKAQFRSEGRLPVLRVRMPGEDIVVNDLVRGEVRFPAGSVPDFVIVRGNGDPLYTLVNPVDDALMRITHIARGEDLLSSTPRQLVLLQALRELGLADAAPVYAHLPLVMGEGNRKLSKRDPQSDLFRYRERGFVREGIVNYLALLGWAIGPDRDVFTPPEFTAAFELGAVNPNPARWDQKKAEAINAEHLRLLAVDDLAARIVPYLYAAGLVGAERIAALTGREQEILRAATPLVQSRMQVLGEAVGMLGFLFIDDAELSIADDARASLREEAPAVLDAAIGALGQVSDFEASKLEAKLRQAIVDDMGIKPKFAFGPLRVAVCGRRVSPPLFESMQILGRDSSMARLRALQASLT
ncbi:MAG: glutamate--tRNA ligase [Micrococcales bacterium]|nr:MAG: glutamate--tRNA ligase [Micrococcales bacterium]PIE27998.1 MAG: glutamate--tRNA ligase [Micrococcales bacterium]